MASRVKVIIDFLSYEGTLTNDPADSEKSKRTVEESAASEVFRRKEAIADATVDQTIPIPDAASEYLLISTDQTISIKLNGSSDALILNPKASGTKTPVYFTRGVISALTVSNASGSTANIDVISVQV